MPSYFKNEVVLVRYPFSDLTNAKVRPAVVMSAPHVSRDLFLVPLTSRTAGLLPGEFVIGDWEKAGLNVPSAVKRGLFTVDSTLVIKSIGQLESDDAQRLERSLQQWLGLGGK